VDRSSPRLRRSAATSSREPKAWRCQGRRTPSSVRGSVSGCVRRWGRTTESQRRAWTGWAATFGPADTWTETEPPTVYRADTDATTSPLLGLDEDEATITVDRTLTDPATGTRYLQRVTIPLATAAGTTLVDEPTRPVAELYTALAAAGHKPAWTETVHARMPQPDERSALRIPDAAPLLLLRRITHDATTGQPLIREELRTRADGAAVRHDYRNSNELGIPKFHVISPASRTISLDRQCAEPILASPGYFRRWFAR